jgi:hypothetical protein
MPRLAREETNPDMRHDAGRGQTVSFSASEEEGLGQPSISLCGKLAPVSRLHVATLGMGRVEIIFKYLPDN